MIKLLHEPLNVEAVRLTAPPKHGTCLATGGQLLIMWDDLMWKSVADRESGKHYHLAFYHPAYGWRACRWDYLKHGDTSDVRLASESAIWVSTDSGKLIYISVEGKIGATMLASAGNSTLHILHADADNLWILERGASVVQLRLQKEGLTIVNKTPISVDAYLLYPLEDGAWVLVGNGKICVFQSPLLEKKIYEEKGRFGCYPPFLVKDFYYTEDPRRGWKRIPIAVESAFDRIAFFAKYDHDYYAAVYRHLTNRTLLYRFSGESKTDVEYMWEISRLFRTRNAFITYGGLVCVADDDPLVISGREDVPENQGFLAWDPQSNAFYEDISLSSIMHAGRIIPRKLQIPTAWSDRGKGQEIQGADR